MQFRVLMPSDKDEILAFEKVRLSDLSPEEAMFTHWKAPWREESLDFYLPKGWSFGAFENNKLVGYFLAQPFLFFQSYTQVLWLEHIQACSQSHNALLDIAYRTAREKHLQKLMFPKKIQHQLDAVDGSAYHVIATSKISE